MFFWKEKREVIEKMQACLEGIQANNSKLADSMNGIVEKQSQLADEISSIQANSINFSSVVKKIGEGSVECSREIEEVKHNNQSLTETLAGVLDTTKTAFNNINESKAVMQDMVEKVQSNNLILADTLQNVIKANSETDATEKKLHTDEEKWLAAYALNICTISVSQIIEYDDIRFMDQEYNNILNNLNLENIPKDEALLDILNRILDIINFFRIHEKEKELLNKEYQQKIKDAIWAATPSPTVLLSNGSKGMVGLAVSLAVTLGTAYMNFRKEKAKIGLEQERKEWELERSLMEQLHGLRRQLFETSWRLADEYGFSDNIRLTEKQVKQFNDILKDDDPMRQYYRLEYVQDLFYAYPPFFYYLGSAAVKIAYDFKDEPDVCREYLNIANEHFDTFFKNSTSNKKLLREDPIVAQCAFEYISVLEMKEEMGLLSVSQAEKNNLIEAKLKLAVESSGNSLDALQMCAINYLAIDRTKDAIKLLKMLVNEFYNVSSNAQLLSMLYVKTAMVGNEEEAAEAEVEYKLLTQTCPYKTEFYQMPKSKMDYRFLDREFCERQKKYLARRYLKAAEGYLIQNGERFNEIWSSDYNITEDCLRFFEDFSKAMKLLYGDIGEDITEKNLSAAFEEIRNNRDMSVFWTEVSCRSDYHYDFFVKNTVVSVIEGVFRQLKEAKYLSEISKIDSKLQSFCNKYSLVTEKNEVAEGGSGGCSIESILTGKTLEQVKYENTLFDELVKIIRDSSLSGMIVKKDSKEVGCFYYDSYQCEDYIKKYTLQLKGRVLAVVEGQKRWKWYEDLIFTTESFYVVRRCQKGSFNILCDARGYEEITFSNDRKGIDYQNKKIYAHKDINYDELMSLIYKLRKVVANKSSEKIINPYEKIVAALPKIGQKISGPVSNYQKNSFQSTAVANVLSVTETDSGIALMVDIKKGSFERGDCVYICHSDGYGITEDYIAAICIQGQNFDTVGSGEKATFLFENIEDSQVDVDSEIKK